MRTIKTMLLLLAAIPAICGAALTENQRIESTTLGYALQYRVYVPDGIHPDSKLQTIYLLDGQWYLENGQMVNVLDQAYRNGQTGPIVAVFIDSRNPDMLGDNRRNNEFICNPKYIAFVVQELIPVIASNYPVSPRRVDRVVGGLSFGGMGAACFGLIAPAAFGGIAMQSPANADHIEVLTKQYKKAPPGDFRVFLSVGKRNDNTKAVRGLHKAMRRKKGYDVSYIEVDSGHDWGNWGPLLDDLLVRFFGSN